MERDSARKDTKPDHRTRDRQQRLDTLLDDIRKDAKRDSSRYLRETIVPAGGE